MKNLVNSIIIFILIFSMINCSDSQNFQGRMSPAERAAQLKETLDLSDEQTKKVEQIYEEWQKKMSELRDQYQGDRSKMREEMMKNREDLNGKIEDLLYEDQIELYREYREEREQFRRQRREQRQRQ
jgi:F0F1-type ATP synthase membrane subunit b/b'